MSFFTFSSLDCHEVYQHAFFAGRAVTNIDPKGASTAEGFGPARGQVHGIGARGLVRTIRSFVLGSVSGSTRRDLTAATVRSRAAVTLTLVDSSGTAGLGLSP
jgi:hypothetical protein